VGGPARSAENNVQQSACGRQHPHPSTLRVADLPLKGGGRKLNDMKANKGSLGAMSNTTKSRRLAAAFGALALLAMPTRAQAADTVRVGTPEATAFVFAVLDVGSAAGIFKKHDIEIQRLNFGGGGKMQQAMVAGAIDVAVGGGTDLAFVARGAPERAVASMAGAPLDMAVIVRMDGSADRIEQLKGKSIGVTTAGSLTSWLAMEMARREGWGPEGVVRAAVGDMSGEVAALLAKNVDAIVGPLEGGYVLEAAGRAKVLISFGDVIKDFVAHVILASDDMRLQHPETLRRFLKGWFETIVFMRQNRAEAIRLSQAVMNVPPEIAARVYDAEMPALSETGRFDPAAVEVVKRSFIELKLLTSVPDNAALIDESFLP
jgi:NitT/TauT family transport system substrate-binding protein